MPPVVLFLAGFFVGGLLVRMLIVRGPRPEEADPRLTPSMRAMVRHVRTHGTVNLAQAQLTLAMPADAASRYLAMLERQGVLKKHEHVGGGTFYTLR